MLLMGESINGTRKQVAEAIAARDAEFIKALALDQVNAGAGLLDVNGGVAGGKEVDDLLWLIDVVMSVTEMQLMVDSANPEALDAGVRAIVGKGGKVPFINSISGEQPRIDAVLPLVEKYKCPVVGLCLSDEGIPPTAEDRFAVAKKLYDLCTGAGLPPEDLWIDPLVMAVSADAQAGVVTMQTLRLVKDRLPVRTTGGLSNVSFGLPNRPLLNRTFVAMCAGIGIDGAVLDVRNKEMMAAVKAMEALRAEDNFCGRYLKAHRAGLLGRAAIAAAVDGADGPSRRTRPVDGPSLAAEASRARPDKPGRGGACPNGKPRPSPASVPATRSARAGHASFGYRHPTLAPVLSLCRRTSHYESVPYVLRTPSTAGRMRKFVRWSTVPSGLATYEDGRYKNIKRAAGRRVVIAGRRISVSQGGSREGRDARVRTRACRGGPGDSVGGVGHGGVFTASWIDGATSSRRS